ncbi:MAG: hypothetical protein GY711_24145 [bacterium]|nr:hypothetical protein [bacterium]
MSLPLASRPPFTDEGIRVGPLGSGPREILVHDQRGRSFRRNVVVRPGDELRVPVEFEELTRVRIVLSMPTDHPGAATSTWGELRIRNTEERFALEQRIRIPAAGGLKRVRFTLSPGDYGLEITWANERGAHELHVEPTSELKIVRIDAEAR